MARFLSGNPSRQENSPNEGQLKVKILLQPICLSETNFVRRNKMPKQLFVALLGAVFSCATLSAQDQPLIHQPTLTPQDSGTTNGLIAVWPVNPRVVWASGRNGTFTVTTDGGETWNAGVVPGAEALQFRDVQGFSARVAYLMSIGGNPT